MCRYPPPPCHLPMCRLPPPPLQFHPPLGWGTITWPKKQRKYWAPKKIFYKAPKLIYTVILWYSFVVQNWSPPRGGTVIS